MDRSLGDEEARGLLSQITPGVRRNLQNFAFAITRDTSGAELVVEESITKAVQKIDSSRPEKFLPFLKMIVRNASLDWLKRWKRSRTYLESTRGKTIPSALAEVTSREAVREFRRAVSRLSFCERRIVVLRVLRRMKFPMIAARLGMTCGNARTMFHRAKGRLKDWFDYMEAG